jgi:surface polysaccharide O-acyltransferase-like enzyme
MDLSDRVGAGKGEVASAAGPERILYADLLRIVAIAAVVCLHAAAGLAASFGTVPRSWWWAGNVFDALSRWSVGVFIMISGVLLLGHGRDLPIGQFMRKRLTKVLVPYVVWVVVFVAWKTWVLHRAFSWRGAIGEFFQGTTFYHFWFIYVILGLYIIAPVLRVYVRNASESNLLYLVGVWLVFLSVTHVCRRFLNLDIALNVELAGGYAGYFVLGYTLDRVEAPVRFRLAVYGLAVAAAVVTVWGTYSLTEIKGSLDQYLYEYLSPNTIIIAAAIFMAVRYAPWDRVFSGARRVGVITALSGASFGIYLVHPLVLWALGTDRVGAILGAPISANLFGRPGLGIPLTALLTLGVSLAIVLLLRRIPLGRYVVP